MNFIKWVVAPMALVAGLVAAAEALGAWWARRRLKPCTSCGARPVGASPRGGCQWPDGSEHCFAQYDAKGRTTQHICLRCAVKAGIVHLTPLTLAEVQSLLQPVPSSSESRN